MMSRVTGCTHRGNDAHPPREGWWPATPARIALRAHPAPAEGLLEQLARLGEGTAPADGPALLRESARRLVRLRGVAPEIATCRAAWAEHGTGGAPRGNVYVNGPGAPGLPLHTDPYDLLVVQLSGRKAWEFNAGDAPPQRIELAAGEAVWVPRGTPHRAAALPGAGPSVHASLHDGDDAPEPPSERWPLRGGRFAPTSWPPAARGSLREEVTESVRRAFARACGDADPARPAGVWLRGSVLEQAHPHPQADVDLLVLGGDAPLEAALREALAPLDRQLDLVRLSPGALGPLERMLLACRTERLCGRAYRVRAPVVDEALLRALWRGSTSRGGSAGPVGESKRAIRAAGVLSLAGGGAYARDLGACVELAAGRGWAIAGALASLRDALAVGRPMFPQADTWQELGRIAATLRLVPTLDAPTPEEDPHGHHRTVLSALPRPPD